MEEILWKEKGKAPENQIKCLEFIKFAIIKQLGFCCKICMNKNQK